jgi:hypothetical protein
MSKWGEGLYIAIRPKGKKVSVITIGTKQIVTPRKLVDCIT